MCFETNCRWRGLGQRQSAGVITQTQAAAASSRWKLLFSPDRRRGALAPIITRADAGVTAAGERLYEQIQERGCRQGSFTITHLQTHKHT